MGHNASQRHKSTLPVTGKKPSLSPWRPCGLQRNSEIQDAERMSTVNGGGAKDPSVCLALLPPLHKTTPAESDCTCSRSTGLWSAMGCLAFSHPYSPLSFPFLHSPPHPLLPLSLKSSISLQSPVLSFLHPKYPTGTLVCPSSKQKADLSSISHLGSCMCCSNRLVLWVV